MQSTAELIERYLQAVRFWMPKAQPDLVAELADDLRSQVDEKEEEVGHPLNEREISAILKRCGSPITVAARLSPQQHLIGPTLFPAYWFVLKMVLLWILLPVFLFIVGPVNLANANGDWGAAVVTTLGNLWSGMFIAAGIVTLVFAILEYTHAVAGIQNKWNPKNLPPVRKQEGRPSFLQTACELMFGIFGFIWLLLIVHSPILILGPAASFLKAAPLWHTFYYPILALSLIAPVRCAFMLSKPQWTGFPIWSQLLQTALSLILLNFMIAAALQTSSSPWQPFVVPVYSAAESAHYAHVATIANASIFLSMAGVWIGLSIAAVIQTWKLVRHIRRRSPLAMQSVSLQVL